LKLDDDDVQLPTHCLSERHPEKQGLKLTHAISTATSASFQSAIQKNKD